MKISDTEKLNTTVVHGSQGYNEWAKRHHLPNYLVIILYELLIRQRLTQRELVELSDEPKQSINKGIKWLQAQNYLTLETSKEDKRAKFCQLTPAGKKFAQEKLADLFEIEQAVAAKMGKQKMQELINLNDEWSNTFWHLLKERNK